MHSCSSLKATLPSSRAGLGGDKAMTVQLSILRIVLEPSRTDLNPMSELSSLHTTPRIPNSSQIRSIVYWVEICL